MVGARGGAAGLSGGAASQIRGHGLADARRAPGPWAMAMPDTAQGDIDRALEKGNDGAPYRVYTRGTWVVRVWSRTAASPFEGELVRLWPTAERARKDAEAVVRLRTTRGLPADINQRVEFQVIPVDFCVKAEAETVVDEPGLDAVHIDLDSATSSLGLSLSA